VCSKSFYCDPCQGKIVGTKDCSMPIPIVKIGSAFLQAQAGTPLTYTIMASNSPISYSVTGLPPSGTLVLNSSTGVISGTPYASDAGTYLVSLRATNNSGTSGAASVNLQILVPAGLVKPTITFTSPKPGQNITSTNPVPLTVNVAAANNNGSIKIVQFVLDGINLGSPIRSAPYTYPWSQTTANNGSHVISAIVTDNYGLTATATAPVTTNIAIPCLPDGASVNVSNSSCGPGANLDYSVCCSRWGTYNSSNLPGNGGSDPGFCDSYGWCGPKPNYD
jgi:hypothetical protein